MNYSNLLKRLYSKIQKIIIGLNNFGMNSIIKFPYKIWGSNHIEIGDDVFIAENSFLCAVEEFNGYKYNPHIKIGNHVTIGSNFFVTAVDEVIIEDNVLMSDRVFIGDNIHAYEDVSLPIIDQKVISKDKVHVKEGSFIGINAVILPGVTIGKHAVVGASSVVSKDVPDFSIVSGIPAHIIKRYNSKTKKWEKVK